ncbi:MAG: GTP-binding protein [Steroidobacteraceae bacterium]
MDARKGVLAQTRRHSYICSLFGILHAILAINKIDLVDYSGERFHQIVSDYLGFARSLEFTSITPIPLSARFGDNGDPTVPENGLVSGAGRCWSTWKGSTLIRV